MNIRRLRIVTILAPVAFLLGLEAFSLFALGPSLGSAWALRLVILFAILLAAVVPFSLWVFTTIERQQRDLLIRNRQLDATNAAISSISGQLDLSSVLQSITDHAREMIGCKYAALGVSNDEGRIMGFITSGITPEQRAAIGPLPVGHGLLGALIKEGKPLRVPDLNQDPRRHGFPANHPPMKSLLGVPILFQNRPVGDLYLTDKNNGEAFTDEDQQQLVLLSNHAAVAIENARLYGEVIDARDRLQAWNAELEARVAERTREIQRYSKEITTRVLQAQEEERKRIARELHDDTAQSLSTLLINLDLLEGMLPRGSVSVEEGFDRLRTLTRRTLNEVRALSHDLRPTILDDFGLVAALNWYAEEYSRTYNMKVKVDADDIPEDRLPPEVETLLFRIAQEALTNSAKHGRANWTRVSLHFPNGSAKLVVQDDGKGFDVSTVGRPTRSGGLGMYGMRERADLLNALLTIDSAPGEGTTVSVIAPLHIEESRRKGARSDAE